MFSTDTDKKAIPVAKPGSVLQAILAANVTGCYPTGRHEPTVLNIPAQIKRKDFFLDDITVTI